MSGETYLIFYDGRCRICTRARQTVERLKPTAPVRWVDVNDAAEMARHPEMAGADVRGQMHVRDPDGHLSGGYDALVALAPILPALAWLGPLPGWVPVRAVGRWVYRWLADNRYRLGGEVACRGGACAFDPAAARPARA